MKFLYKVIVNGRRSSNGKLFSVTVTGDCDSEMDLPETAKALVDHAFEHAAESGMEITEGVQVTIESP